MLPFLVAIGVIQASEVNQIANSVMAIVAGVQATVTLVTYIVQRSKLKAMSPGPSIFDEVK